MAVGGAAFESPSPHATIVADIWDGKAWSSTRPVSPGHSQITVDSVSCSSSRDCIAVGYYDYDRTLIERWDGSRWSLQKPAPFAGSSAPLLTGVSCSAASSCMAVGFYQGRGFTRTVAERWDGTDWSLTKTIDYAHSSRSELRGVSCSSPSLCMAVGGGLVERWNGTKWSLQPNSSHQLDLNGVSCTSRTWCMAVGSYGPLARAYAQRWNGQRWSPLRARSPSNSIAVFKGVSCSAQNRCTAVGQATNRQTDTGTPLIERWNGTRSTVIHAQNYDTRPHPHTPRPSTAPLPERSRTATAMQVAPMHTLGSERRGSVLGTV